MRDDLKRALVMLGVVAGIASLAEGCSKATPGQISRAGGHATATFTRSRRRSQALAIELEG
jgi:hypothetical protein